MQKTNQSFVFSGPKYIQNNMSHPMRKIAVE